MLNSVEITIVDPGIPKSQDSRVIPLIVGTCEGGSTTEIQTATSPAQLLDEAGVGPLSRCGAYMLKYGGRPIRWLRLATDAAGACSAVTQTGSGPAMTVLVGTARDRYAVTAKIVKGGDLATAQCQIATDDWGVPGLNPKYGPVTTIPANGEVVIPGTGITVDFAAGTHVVGTTHHFTSTAPEPAPDALASMTSLFQAYQLPWKILVNVNDFADVDDAYTNAASMDTLLTALRAVYRHKHGIVGAGLESASAVLASGLVTTLSTILVSPMYGEAQTIGAVPIAGYESRPRIPAHVVQAMRCSKRLFSTDPRRVASGPLEGVVAITHDEFTQANLDDVRIGTLRTYPTLPGYYVEKARIRSSATSDFKYTQHALIMNEACDVLTMGLLRYVGETLRTEAGTGYLSEEDAATIKNDLEAQLRATLMTPKNEFGTLGHVSALEFEVLRDHNVLEDETINTELGVQPHVYPTKLTAQVGYRVVQAA